MEITDGNVKLLTGLPACHLQCEEYGTLLPRPTGKVDINREIIGVNVSAIEFILPTFASQQRYWTETVDRFYRVLDSKIETAGEDLDGKYTMIVKIIVDEENLTMDLSTIERYKLSITWTRAEILVEVTAKSYFGARHGIESLSQLIVFDDLSDQFVMPSRVTIYDEPVYKYRGLQLDTVRSYYTLDAIKRTIDTMALVKLNVFHWHITDSQSFPLMFDSLPEFAQIGAYHPAKIYTISDVKEIVEYAKIRGIRVIPELDLPAHIGDGWQKTEWITCYNAQPWSKYCAGPPCGQLDVTKDSLYPVLQKMYQEMNDAFGVTDLFHMGGDEVMAQCWNVSESIQSYITDVMGLDVESVTSFTKLWAMFQDRVRFMYKQINAKARLILWTNTLTEKEVIDDYIDRDDYVIQVWTSGSGSDSHVPHLLEKGYDVIMSNYDAFYFDCGFGSYVGTGNSWCSPYKAWHQVYNNNLKAMAKEKSSQVLGGEACLWSSVSGEETLDSRLWPRASALAERLWTEPDENFRHVENRLLLHRQLLVQYGIRPESIQPDWCLQHGGDCPT